MKSYKILNNQVFSVDEFSIVPIRESDKFDIMNWRNDQIYHLRQSKPLKKKDQKKYFENVISEIFKDENPDQILFSFLNKDKCVGYGGLVHINWIDKHAEISFIMKTELENLFFKKYWTIFLELIEKVAFYELSFRKIFIYAFDLRQHLYDVVEKSNYKLEARLIDHYLFNDDFIDVVIYSKINK